MAQCNLCALNDIKRYAATTKQVVTLRRRVPNKIRGAEEGRDVFVHPVGVKPKQEHCVGWLMKIPDHCVC